MSGYVVDLGELDEFVGRLVAFGHGLERVRDDVESRMNRVGAVWVGVAAAEHQEVHRRWQAGVTDMQDALRTLHAIASTAHGNYGAAVRANTAMWSR